MNRGVLSHEVLNGPCHLPIAILRCIYRNLCNCTPNQTERREVITFLQHLCAQNLEMINHFFVHISTSPGWNPAPQVPFIGICLQRITQLLPNWIARIGFFSSWNSATLHHALQPCRVGADCGDHLTAHVLLNNSGRGYWNQLHICTLIWLVRVWFRQQAGMDDCVWEYKTSTLHESLVSLMVMTCLDRSLHHWSFPGAA
jgi:hypothetical protein